MIAGCPKCSARYRVDPKRVGPDGAKLRCTKCSAVFLVRAPAPAPAPAAAPTAETEPTPVVKVSAPAPPPVAQASTPSPVPESGLQSAGRAPEMEPPSDDVDSSRLVLIADPNEERGKTSAAAVEAWGLQARLVHDGVEAMLAIQRLLPRVIVLDAALPKMFGFQVCEIVKRNESLRSIQVVLVGAIHHQDRYRRNPSDLYGADIYLEQPDLPDGLLSILRDAGLPVTPDGASASAAPMPSAAGVVPPTEAAPSPPTPSKPAPSFDVPEPAPSPAAASSDAPASGVPDVEEERSLNHGDGLGFEASQPAAAVAPVVPPVEEDTERVAERERAERLARIAVSEMLLYQPEKFDQAVRAGNLEEVLDLEIGEARALITQRIGEEVRSEKDFILDELKRVAADRSNAN